MTNDKLGQWQKLHCEIIDMICNFCKENNIDASEVKLFADGLEESIEQGKWIPATDSSFVLMKMDEEYNRKEILCSM